MAYTTINKSTDYFNTKLYTGNGSTQSITGVGFQPDWLWIKNRNGTNNHILQDAVRGATKSLESDGTGTETTSSTRVTSFDSDGFSIGSAGTNNTNSSLYVSWNWKAGTTGSGNTGGSGTYKTYNYSVNTTAGFSIVKYTGNGTAGQTIPHHLGAVPKLIILKPLEAADNWRVYHPGIDATAPEDYHLQLQSNAARSDHAGIWNDTAPTSTVFTLGSDGGVGQNDQTFIAYCFAEKTGYSHFSTYTANNSSDGPFLYTGFRPAFFIAKRSDGTGNWHMYDDKRIGYNNQNKRLAADVTGAEDQAAIDIVSNGIKIRTNNNSLNNHSGNMIYWAFASAPIVGTNNIPAVAR